MGLYGRDRGRIIPDQKQALDHPLRLRVLELFAQKPERSLAAESLAADLADRFPDVKIRQVAYHVAVLKDARLLPTG
ncbi:MAG TPA: helix-turn-helix domain-containing protein [Solirubrobacterales bacterium]|nr:helix-turn-helix domain-containing protein [Solirubrobacterales bacterium]